MSTPPKLLNCPLCDAEVYWCGSKISAPTDTLHDCHAIICPNCGEFDLSKEDNPDSLEELLTLCAARWNHRAAPKGKVLVDLEPDVSLLASMATRVNHRFGLADAASQQVQLSNMRKVYEEVVGAGFYTPDVQGRYRSWLKNAEPPSSADADSSQRPGITIGELIHKHEQNPERKAALDRAKELLRVARATQLTIEKVSDFAGKFIEELPPCSNNESTSKAFATAVGVEANRITAEVLQDLPPSRIRTVRPLEKELIDAPESNSESGDVRKGIA